MPHLPRPGRLLIVATAVGLAAILLGAATLAGALPGGGGPRPNPDAGLTDQQRDAKYATMRATAEARMDAWNAAFDPSTLDLATLPRAGLMIT